MAAARFCPSEVADPATVNPGGAMRRCGRLYCAAGFATPLLTFPVTGMDAVHICVIDFRRIYHRVAKRCGGVNITRPAELKSPTQPGRSGMHFMPDVFMLQLGRQISIMSAAASSFVKMSGNEKMLPDLLGLHFSQEWVG